MTPMPRSKRLDDAEVLRLSREVILARGAQVSTVEIAAHVGLSQPTLFQRFGDKPTLLRRALAPDPVDPTDILGPAEEAHGLGTPAHVAALAGRLFDAMLMVVERSQVATAGGLHASGARDAAHESGGVPALVAAIAKHLGALPGLRLTGAEATETLLLIVHGAATMALTGSPADRGAVRDRAKGATRRALTDG